MEGGHEYKKGLWNVEEDRVLMDYIKRHGIGKWNRIAKVTALKRCGKSCRLRWMNYLSPDVKRGGFSQEEEDLIIRLHKLLGNRWSLIAGRVPGRTDNQVKNYWNTHLSKKLGVKKEKNKVCNPPTTLPNEQKDNSNSTLKCTKGPSVHNGEGKGDGEFSEKLAKARSSAGHNFTSTDEMIMSDDFESNFWFANSGALNLYTPYLPEPFNDYFTGL